MISLADDPSDSSPDKVLRFKHGTLNASSGNAQRIEGNVSRHIKANRVVCEVELYIPSTIKGDKFKASPIDWFTIQEYWSGRTTGNIERRTTLSLKKKKGDESLFFDLALSDVNLHTNTITNLVENRIADYALEFDKWIRLRVEIEPGDDRNGKIRTVVRPEGGEEYVFEKIVRTVYPVEDYENSPRPIFEDFSVMKLYTSAAYVRNGVFSSGNGGAVSNVEIFFRNCRVDCVCAVDE